MASVAWEHDRWESGEHGSRPTPTPQIVTVEVPVIQERVVAGPEVIHEVPVFIERTITEILEVEVPVLEIRYIRCVVVGIRSVLSTDEQIQIARASGVLVCPD